MNAQELYAEWTSGEKNGMRPKRVQALREEFEEAMDTAVPRRIHEIEGWLEAHQQSGNVTKKLRQAAEEEQADEEESSDGSATEESSDSDTEEE